MKKTIFHHVKFVHCCNKHPDQSEGVRNLCLNIYRHRDSLGDCKSDIDVYHSVFTRSYLYLGTKHVLDVIAYILCSYPTEFVVARMGSVLVPEVLGGSKTSTTINI